jgi:nucleotide-binding universal stress UspA family protein
MITKILVPVDGSPLAEQALPMAEAVARATGASIELLCVHEPDLSGRYPTDTPWNAARREHEAAYVRSLADATWNATGLAVNGHTVTGTAECEICARVGQIAVELIVMTTHGRTGFRREWLGSVADGVISAGCAPVLLVRATPKDAPAPAPPRIDRILVALDGSPRSESILAFASPLAAASGATLVLVEIVMPAPLFMPDPLMTYGTGLTIRDADATDTSARIAAARLDTLGAQLRAAGVRHVESHVVVEEIAAQAVLDAARIRAVDLIAMTNSGRGSSRMLVGSVTDKVMRASQLPLLLVGGSLTKNPA